MDVEEEYDEQEQGEEYDEGEEGAGQEEDAGAGDAEDTGPNDGFDLKRLENERGFIRGPLKGFQYGYIYITSRKGGDIFYAQLESKSVGPGRRGLLRGLRAAVDGDLLRIFLKKDVRLNFPGELKREDGYAPFLRDVFSKFQNEAGVRNANQAIAFIKSQKQDAILQPLIERLAKELYLAGKYIKGDARPKPAGPAPQKPVRPDRATRSLLRAVAAPPTASPRLPPPSAPLLPSRPPPLSPFLQNLQNRHPLQPPSYLRGPYGSSRSGFRLILVEGGATGEGVFRNSGFRAQVVKGNKAIHGPQRTGRLGALQAAVDSDLISLVLKGAHNYLNFPKEVGREDGLAPVLRHLQGLMPEYHMAPGRYFRYPIEYLQQRKHDRQVRPVLLRLARELEEMHGEEAMEGDEEGEEGWYEEGEVYDHGDGGYLEEEEEYGEDEYEEYRGDADDRSPIEEDWRHLFPETTGRGEEEEAGPVPVPDSELEPMLEPTPRQTIALPMIGPLGQGGLLLALGMGMLPLGSLGGGVGGEGDRQPSDEPDPGPVPAS